MTCSAESMGLWTTCRGHASAAFLAAAERWLLAAQPACYLCCSSRGATAGPTATYTVLRAHAVGGNSAELPPERIACLHRACQNGA